MIKQYNQFDIAGMNIWLVFKYTVIVEFGMNYQTQNIPDQKATVFLLIYIIIPETKYLLHTDDII